MNSSLNKFKVMSGLKTNKKILPRDPVMNADQVLMVINGITKDNVQLVSIMTQNEQGKLQNTSLLYKFGDAIEDSYGIEQSLPGIFLEIKSFKEINSKRESGQVYNYPFSNLKTAICEMSTVTREACLIFVVMPDSGKIYGVSSIEFQKSSKKLVNSIIFHRSRQSFVLKEGTHKWWEIVDEF